MDLTRLRNCKKSPSQGGYSRQQVDELAIQLGLDPKKYTRKDDLCDAVLQIVQTRETAAAGTPTAPGIETVTIPTPVTPTLSNPEIARQLTRLADFYAKRGEEYRSKAFRQAAKLIEKFPEPITDPIRQLKGITGVGRGTIDRITELLRTGKIVELGEEPITVGPEIPETTTEEERVMKELQTIFGIGAATATNLVNQGITSIGDLVEKFNKGQVPLNAAQRVGLEFHLHFRERIPRNEVRTVGDYILEVAKSFHPDTEVAVVGSYRRGRPTSGDIDILISNPGEHNDLAKIVQYLQTIGFLKHILSHGDVKLQATYFNSYPNDTGILRKIDIRYVPFASWPTALLHSTGSDQFNIMLRRKALDRGLTLSEYALTDIKTNKPVAVTSEEDVFKLLGMEYVPPEQRDL